MFSRRPKREVEVIDDRNTQREPSQYSTRGDYGLKRCHEAENATADIVFIHGLTGNRETTWRDPNSRTFWPEHLLKEDVPRSRILTFGYDADVTHFWAMASNNRIGNHAMNLVNALAQLRDRTETEDRPIIFVTHSLGGLVFEDALLSSKNSAEPHIQSLLDHTVGVCFLGTPHCGSEIANWASVFGNIASVVRTTNMSLLNVLKPESEVLARIQQEFHTMLRARRNQGLEPLKITCFYEELAVRGIGEIVPKHSAILPAYNAIGIRANHMDMTKFSDAEDPGYLAVSTELRRWARGIQPAQHQPNPYSSTSALAPYEERQQQLPSRQDYYREQAPRQDRFLEQGPRQDYYLEQAPQRHSPWPPQPQTGNTIHGNITNAGMGQFGMNVGSNFSQPDHYNPQQPRQYAPSPHQGQLSPYENYPPPQSRSPSWQGYNSPQPHPSPQQWPSRDQYAPSPHPPAPSPHRHHSDYDSQYMYASPGQQRYADNSYARQPSPYQESQNAGPRLVQGANQINVANQTTSHGGKTVQGMNISSDKDVTFNF
ncbi:MAG: hypothetical protein M1812_007452 [Candelaria pacifica]|nr:MAG: hypothetical protein M1812_007452 [Candelaria pacifica]